jgi:hypothetical protein
MSNPDTSTMRGLITAYVQMSKTSLPHNTKPASSSP